MRDFQSIWLFFCKNELFFIAEKGLYNKKMRMCCYRHIRSRYSVVSYLFARYSPKIRAASSTIFTQGRFL